jgi:hypothetical protein
MARSGRQKKSPTEEIKALREEIAQLHKQTGCFLAISGNV